MMTLTSKMNALASLLLCTVCCAQGYKYVDLSHPMNPSTIYWPKMPTFKRTVISAERNEKGIWIESGVYTSGEHGGTHVDVPKHFIPGALDLKDFPLERTIAEGVLIDCSVEAGQDMDYAVTVEKLIQWENDHGRIPYEAAVMFYFGYAPKFYDPAAYFNTPEWDKEEEFHFPYVSAEAARWLLEERAIKMLATDTASSDGPQILSFPVHMIMLSQNILLLENVNIPKSFPPRDFRVYAPPVRVENGTGIQTRIFAMVYDRTSLPGSSVRPHSTLVILGGSVGVTLVCSFIYPLKL